MSNKDIRYPIGEFHSPAKVTPEQVTGWINEIANLPSVLTALVGPMNSEQLETPYRPDGWCVRQVVHHIADSHMNSLVRFKMALTEERPTIKPYREELWAEQVDYKDFPLDSTLKFIELLHARWVLLLRSLDKGQLAREFVHPDSGIIRMDTNIGIYAWHGRHHLAHITELIAREGWEL